MKIIILLGENYITSGFADGLSLIPFHLQSESFFTSLLLTTCYIGSRNFYFIFLISEHDSRHVRNRRNRSFEIISKISPENTVCYVLKQYLEQSHLEILKDHILYWKEHIFIFLELHKLHLKELCIP